MNMQRYVAPFVSIVFSLSCIIWGIVASSYATSLRIGSTYIGVMFLLVPLVHVLVIFPTEREEISQTAQVSRHISYYADPLSVTFHVGPTGFVGSPLFARSTGT